MVGGDSFINLRQYLKGKIDRWDLMSTDNFIDDVKEVSDKKGESRLRLKFKDNDALKILGLSDDDVWFYNVVNGPYQDYEFETTDSISESFLDGRGIWNYFDSENLSLLKEISKYVYPKNFDIDDEEFLGVFAKKLETLFEKEIYEIIRDYTWEKNREMNQVAGDAIQSELEEESQRLGFKFIDSGTIEMTAGDIFNLFLQSNLTHLPLKKMLEEVLSEKSNIGGFYENQWEYQDDDFFDNDGFNRQANRVLEKILESIQDEHKDWVDYRKMVDEITKKFYVDHWYPIPKTDDYQFKIDGFDKDIRKIIVKIRDIQNTKRKTINLSLENFYNLLYQPELFKFEDLYNF